MSKFGWAMNMAVAIGLTSGAAMAQGIENGIRGECFGVNCGQRTGQARVAAVGIAVARKTEPAMNPLRPC